MRPISQTFRCFDEVVRRGSIRKAAESLHLTAAAVHQQILNLEEQVGSPLFDRLPRGMQLTTAGEIIIAAVRRGQRDFDNAMTQVEDLRSLRRGHINLAVSPSSAEQLVPDAIMAAMQSYPGVTYSVRSGNGESILKWVETGEADIGYGLRRKPPPGVVEVRAFSQHLGLVAPPGHPLTKLNKRPRLRDCLDYPLILMTPDTELRAMVDQIDHREKRKARPLVETSSVSMVRRLVADGVGIGFLIAENVAEDVAQRKLAWLALADAGARSFSCLYQRADLTTTVAMSMFLQFLGQSIETTESRFHASTPTRRKRVVKVT
ncbi:LysR family transcriptional regulator [Paraburkholderia bryophila]|uniref:DNA-binding transcriptional LysR family regulator n=1 Tax=Paraburkholderia bryophila TaxID=420952 RepID=A0A7Y9W9F2_9BURK|nr:LysR family transcriptional regulator [Paraburkholderia bryophila]NYH16258.1 DNA-binding transcriptional LysR family regulator [Paraburkholderia bryophila]